MNEQLLKAFKESGWSRYKLAKETGIIDTTIYRWAKGNAISVEKCELIAKALGFIIAIVALNCKHEKTTTNCSENESLTTCDDCGRVQNVLRKQEVTADADPDRADHKQATIEADKS